MDLERKSSADERELYEGAVSEKTKIEQSLIKNGENHRLSTFVFSILDYITVVEQSFRHSTVFLFAYA